MGAGPGDPGLFSCTPCARCSRRTWWSGDRLVSDEVMALVRRDAKRIFVGKRAGNHCDAAGGSTSCCWRLKKGSGWCG